MNENDEYDGQWYAYENGATKGSDGENGLVLRDEQLGDEDDWENADARITLEQGGTETPGFFITATLYGWLFVTTKRTIQTEAEALYDAMKAELTRLAALIPFEEDGKTRIAEKARLLSEGVAEFERAFG